MKIGSIDGGRTMMDRKTLSAVQAIQVINKHHVVVTNTGFAP
jgi:hypothetical protein